MKRFSLFRYTTTIFATLSLAMPTDMVQAQNPAAKSPPKTAETTSSTCEASKDEELSRNYTLCLTGASLAGCPVFVAAAALPVPFFKAEAKSKQALDMVEKLTTLQREAAKQQMDYFRLEQLREMRTAVIEARNGELRAANQSSSLPIPDEAHVRIRQALDYIDSVNTPPNAANENPPPPENVERFNHGTRRSFAFPNRPTDLDDYIQKRIQEIDAEIQAIERKIDPQMREKLEVANKNLKRALDNAGKTLGDVDAARQTGAMTVEQKVELKRLQLALEQEDLAKLENYHAQQKNGVRPDSSRLNHEHRKLKLDAPGLSKLIMEQRAKVAEAESNWNEALEARNRIVRDIDETARRNRRRAVKGSLGAGALDIALTSLDYSSLYSHCRKQQNDLPKDLREVVAFDENCEPSIPIDERGKAYFEIPKAIRNAMAAESKILCAATQNTNKKVQSDLKEVPEVDIDARGGKCDVTIKYRGREYHHVLVRDGDAYNLMGSFIPGRRPAASRDMFAFRVQLNADLEPGVINSDNINWSGGFRDRGKLTAREAIKTYHETPDPVIPNEQNAQSYTGIDPRAYGEMMNSAGEQFTLMKSYLNQARTICALEHQETAAAQDKANGTKTAPRTKSRGSTDNP